MRLNTSQLRAWLLHALLAWAVLPAVRCAFSSEVEFLRDVRPILSSHCFKCHGPDETTRKGGLRLDIREQALKPAKSGMAAIVPGEPVKSELFKRISTADEDDLMPPPAAKHPLSEAQKETLRKWIAAGAEYQPHWAFVKPMAKPLPPVQKQEWPANGIDYFILARLEREGLNPAEPADRYTMVRRVYLDLIGLPPTPQQVDDFINDSSSNAYERLVNELLASPHYGERWARRWLDLARYADTNGYEKDRPRSIWPYRDWLISALNRDLPFDQFTIEQIAGDMLPNATADQIIATGFHRNTMINEEGGIDPLEYRFYSMVDRVHVTATTWLGLTMACAQCHTHKYDPIQHSEYYQFMALMNNADEPTMPVPDAKVAAERAGVEKQIADLEARLIERFPAPVNIEWVVPSSAEFKSDSGAEGEFLTDGSLRVSGTNPDKDTYNLSFNFSPRTVSHVQLEAIPDDGSGPGRTEHGNFVLSEIEIEVGGEKRKLTGAESDFAQEGFPVLHAIDGKLENGWAVDAKADKRVHRRAIFTLLEPLPVLAGSTINVRLVHQYGGRHTLRRFRVSFGTSNTEPAEIAARSREHRDKKLAAWLDAELKKLVTWESRPPTEATSQTPVLTIEKDAVFATGDFTKNDTFKLKYKDVPAGTRAIRLEALADARLPKNGPGTVSYEGPEGDFYLSTVNIRAHGRALTLTNATESFASGNNKAATSIDDDLQSGWSINGGQGRDHVAVFQLTQPLEQTSDLEIDLTFERYYAAALGKLRIAFTAAENARASSLPLEAYNALLKYKDQSAHDFLVKAENPDRELLLREFAQVAPELAGARKEIDDLRAKLPQFATTLVMRERHFNRATYRYHRGEFLQPKEKIEPGLPAFLPGLPEGASNNRLGFARWLVSPENPLTARVVMNRHWEAFFGRGLVRTLEDFGFQGELPSHPELLDWLALEFVKQGWSQKKMHKLIVMSATYRQSSHVRPELRERDPQNVLLARGPRFRIDAEVVRDAALVASGLFAEKLGGPSVYPPQPGNISTEGAYGQLQWKTSQGADRYRRGLYTFAKRTAPYAMTTTFDGPSGEACLARRDRSNTPLQALTLLNDQVFIECARESGKWAAQQSSDPAATTRELFRRFLSRLPTEDELRKIEGFYAQQVARFKSGELKAAELVGTESASPEQAAWTAVVRVLLNLDETVTKS